MTESKHYRPPLTEDEPRKSKPYASTHNKLSVLWKQRTGTLPPEAKAFGIYLRDGNEEGPYPVCLPREYASYNLLPEVRDGALGLFKDLDSRGTTASMAGRATTCATPRSNAPTPCSRWLTSRSGSSLFSAIPLTSRKCCRPRMVAI